ncbi:MAG: PKD domain-containing protein, partial [Chitinophagaceae bacterium]
MTRLYFLIRFNALLLLLLAWSGSGLYAQITASFSISPSQGCAPQVVNFTSTCTGTITGYSWSFGNGTSVSHLQNPSTTYTSTGTYTITLTVTGSGGPKTATGSVTIYASPTVSLSFTPSAGCNPLSVSFSSVISPGVSGSVTQLWDFQDGVTSSSSNPSHNYTTSGTYYPVLSVTNSKGCTGTYISTNAVTVYPKPSVSFSAYPRGFCTPSGLVNFTGSVGSGSSPYTYSWDYGDGGGYSPGSLSSSHNYYTVGSFTVKLKVTDAKGCTDSSVQTNFVTTHQNLASFSGPTTACVSTPFGPPPQTYSSNTFFKNTTPGFTASSTYWDFGDLSNAYGDSLGHAYTTPGTYTIKMVTQVGPCADTATKTITINPRPATNVTWTPDPNCPAPVTINFTATGGKNYSWSWSSGGTATGATASKYYPIDPLKDTLLLITLDSNGCSDTVQRVVTIHNIKIQVLNPYKGCVPFTYKPQVLLLDYVSGNGLYPYPTPKSVHWDFGDGDTSNSDTPTHVYITPGIYKRVVTITTVNGCTQTDTSNVYVGDKFKPSFTFMPDTVCPKVQVYFTNTSGRPPTQNFTYLWDVGVAVSYVNSVDAIAIYSVPGIYNIILYADSNGCIDSTMCSGCMVVLPANADFTDSIPCPPNNLTAIFINSSVGATSNHWSFGDGTNSTLANPTHIYADTGVYVAQLITTNNIYGCTDTMAISIRLSNPQIDFHATDTTLCEQDTLHLIPTATGSATLNRCIWTVDSLTHLLDTFGHGQIFVMRPFSLVYPLGLKTPIVGY